MGALALFALACNAQGEYDDDSYGNQGGGNGQDDDNYGNSYNNDDGYNNQPTPNYQQNVDSDGSNNSPNSYSPQGASDANGDYEDDENSAASAPVETVVAAPQRIKRSTSSTEQDKKQPEQAAAESAPKLRVKRHGKYYIGPVYTYVKTDKHANFKWGVSSRCGQQITANCSAAYTNTISHP